MGQALAPHLQRKAIGHLLQEIAGAGKIVCGWWGNHDDERDERLIGESRVAGEFARAGIPYFGVRGELTLRVGTKTPVYYAVVGLHKARFNSYLNETHSAGQTHRVYTPHADLVATAHRHSPAFHGCMRPSPDGRAERWVWFVRTGTFKTDWLGDDLSARSFKPGAIGIPTAVFHAGEKKIVMFADPVSAVSYLRSLS